MWGRSSVLLALLLCAGCQQPSPASPVSTSYSLTYDDLMRRRADVERRTRNGEFNSARLVEEASRREAERHVSIRVARNDIDGPEEVMLARAVTAISGGGMSVLGMAAIHDRPGAVPGAQPRAVVYEPALLRRIANAPAPERELQTVSAEVVGQRSPPPVGAARAAAIREIAGELRGQVEEQHRKDLLDSRAATELQLANTAEGGLADMPREIRYAAERLTAFSRPPFAADRSSPPTEPAIREEEVRIRSAVEMRLAAIRRDAATAALITRRAEIQAMCDRQGTYVSNNTPIYIGRGNAFAGIMASALVATLAEERTRRDCYQLNGL